MYRGKLVGETTERRDRQGSGDSDAGVAESDRLERRDGWRSQKDGGERRVFSSGS